MVLVDKETHEKDTKDDITYLLTLQMNNMSFSSAHKPKMNPFFKN